MQRHCEKEISIDGVYLHALFLSFLAWSSTIRCTRSYFCHCMMLIKMERYCENKINSNSADLNAFFGLLIA